MSIKKIRLTVAYDGTEPGIAWHRETFDGEEWDMVGSNGWKGPGPREAHAVDAWFKFARRKLRLPHAVGKAGLRWKDAEVKPVGYSQGPGHTQDGITITWLIPG